MTAPPPPTADLAPMIGQYGRSGALLDIFEADGALWATGLGNAPEALERIDATLFKGQGGKRHVAFEANGGWALVDGERLLRCDVGAELVAAFQQSLDAEAYAASPQSYASPSEALVSLADIAGIRLDIRYATPNNFMGFAIYDRPCAYARLAVVEAVARVQAVLAAQGYGLVVHDAYRPWSVTKMFWDVVPLASRAFVADPAIGSKHNRGCAIDLSLCDAKRGALLEMPSRYDEPTGRAHSLYHGGTSLARWHRDLLRAAMEAEGFAVQADEWWHFDFHAWRDYPIENVSFAALGG
ncbi:M15 family metallopeptidase [Sphingomonas sp. RT2P30]|uniref:M15 family metallopeptidase n=1 Tax=Parasphingomonas halimpatiens TaxID=3096162 RepID=UPI002FCBCBA7